MKSYRARERKNRMEDKFGDSKRREDERRRKLRDKIKGFSLVLQAPLSVDKKNRVPPKTPQGTCKLFGNSKHAIESTFMI